MSGVSAQLFKLKMEREVLREHELSFASFSTLFIVWIWGPIETQEIAKSQAVSKATVTSLVNTLEETKLGQAAQCKKRQKAGHSRTYRQRQTTY